MNQDDTLKLMKERRSIRSYKSDPVSDKDIEKILEAARWCQSASNRQPWRFIVIKDRELIRKIAGYAAFGWFISEVNVVIAIVADKRISPKWYINDSAMVSHQICLMAWSMGLGTCWVGSLDQAKVSGLLNLGENEYLTTVLPIGYPESIPAPTTRKNLKDIVSYIE